MKVLNKIMLIGIVFALLLTAAACGDEAPDESESSITESKVISASDDVSEASQESDSTYNTDESSANYSSEAENFADESSEAESSAEDSTSQESSEAVSSETESSEAESYEDESTVSESEEPDTSGEDIIGSGTENDPYMFIPNTENMTVETTSIPAGQSCFFGIYRVGGMILTIEDPNAYVVYNGTKYEPENGKISFTIDNALASDAINFEIGNSSESARIFIISFVNPVGSLMNPAVVTDLIEVSSLSLPKDSDAGYYDKYTAEKDGSIRFYMTASVDSVMLVTNNRNSAQRSSEADNLSDENGEYVEIEVKKGDEIIINVGAKPNKRGKYPAADISWYGKYN